MQENRKLRILTLTAFSFILIGMSFFIGSKSKYAAQNIQILYISQAEIIALEKARIGSEKATDKQLFFGKPSVAVEYIEQEQERMIKSGDLVLVTDSKIYGSNVRSVSKEVHEEIIDKLRTNQR